MRIKRFGFWSKTAVFLLVAAAILSIWPGYVSVRYDLPFQDVSKNLVRYVALKSISLGVKIYDPTERETIRTKVGPDDEQGLHESLPRLEGYFAGVKQQDMRLNEVHNEKIITSRYQFSYQPDTPRLREIREKMELDKVVAGVTDDIERMALLREWVRKQFSRKDYQKWMDRFDAVDVWENPQRNPSKRKCIQGVEYNPCHFFPLFYSQVMLSMGYTARLVGITETGYGSHGFTEVWSNQYGKWITMDPDLNLLYLQNGEPLNMLQVHNARYDSGQQLKVVQHIVEPGVQPVETAKNMIDYHRYIKIADLRNDWLTNKYFRGHPRRSDLATLCWQDDREPAIWLLFPSTNRPEDFYWSLNQVELYVQPEKTQNGVMALHFNTVTPNFSYFEIDDNGDVKRLTTSSWVWKLKTGENKLSVTPVNSFGVKGITSWIKVAYDVEQSN